MILLVVSYSTHLELTTVVNDNLGAGGTRARADSFNRLDNIHAFRNSSEDDVLAVQPRSLGRAKEELRAVGVCDVQWKAEIHENESHQTSHARLRKYSLGPAFAMERIPGPVCYKRRRQSICQQRCLESSKKRSLIDLTFNWKFSSANLLP